MIKIIMFDIGGVILDSERSIGSALEEFGNALSVSGGEINALYERDLPKLLVGKISSKQFFAAIKKEFHVKGDLKKAWLVAATKRIALNKALLKVIDTMRSGYRVAVLSNVGEMRGMLDEALGLYQHFDHVFLSYKLKMKKPSKNIFRYALKKMKVKPEEVLFIDDKEANLKTARELGIKCIQFNNNAQLMTELKRWGLV